jgi:hypothetical protein
MASEVRKDNLLLSSMTKKEFFNQCFRAGGRAESRGAEIKSTPRAGAEITNSGSGSNFGSFLLTKT